MTTIDPRASITAVGRRVDVGTQDVYEVRPAYQRGLGFNAESRQAATVDELTALLGDVDIVDDGETVVGVRRDVDWQDALTDLGRMWEQARETERLCAGAAYALIRAAVADHVTESDAARWLDVNRMTVRNALGKR